jgi:hypothetical protein
VDVADRARDVHAWFPAVAVLRAMSVSHVISFVMIAFMCVAMIAAVVAVYYAFSYAVLWLVGKAFPLTGRRRR